MLSIVGIGGKQRNEKNMLKIISVGKKRYLKNETKGYPDMKTIKNKMQIINKTVDKFDCIINEQTKIVGNIICKKNAKKVFNLSLNTNKFRQRNKIRLYLANSDG